MIKMVIKNSVDICKFNEAFIQVALYLLLISHPNGGKKENKFYSPISYLNRTIQKALILLPRYKL